MYGNILYLEHEEAVELLKILREKRASLIKGEGDEQRCTDERLYDIVVEIENELVNYSSDHKRILNNLQCLYEKEQMAERNPDLLNKAYRNELKWAKAVFDDDSPKTVKVF